MRKHNVRHSRPHIAAGPLEFCDPMPLCMGLYLLLLLDHSGYFRLTLLAACLHEWGHILMYLALFRRWPIIAVTCTGFCMRTKGGFLTRGQTALLAAAGPAVNLLLALLCIRRLRRRFTLRLAAFWAANLLTAVFNLVPVSPLDGAALLSALLSEQKAAAKNKEVEH